MREEEQQDARDTATWRWSVPGARMVERIKEVEMDMTVIDSRKGVCHITCQSCVIRQYLPTVVKVRPVIGQIGRFAEFNYGPAQFSAGTPAATVALPQQGALL